MLCTISRWMISRAEDTGKKLPGFVERHIGHCRGCGAFVRASMSLSAGLKAGRSDLLAGVPDFVIDLEGTRVAGERRAAATTSRAPHRFLFGLRPLPVAAAALLMAVTGVLLFQVTRREPAPAAQDLSAARAAIKSLTSAPQELPGVVGQAESALDRERRILEKSLVSAVDYLQARLNITIERKDRSKPL